LFTMTFDPLQSVAGCPFCGIAATYGPTPPTAPVAFDPDLVAPSAFVVLSSPLVMAFLDIMPLSPGHLLVTARKHHEKVSDVTEEESRELGYWLPVLSRVLAKTTGVWDWNIVQNNGMCRRPHCLHSCGNFSC
jgi:diadenosine tetraphosphate (Ap4A) HIT family hydrolase